VSTLATASPGNRADRGVGPESGNRSRQLTAGNNNTRALSLGRGRGPGTLGIEVQQNFSAYDAWELGDTELTVSDEAAVRGPGLTVEVEPALSAGGDFALSARLVLTRSCY
jgi:hypothetical protein